MDNAAHNPSDPEIDFQRTFYAMFEATLEGLATLTPGGSVSFSNSRLAEILGTDADKLIGSRFDSFIAPNNAERFQALIQQVGEVGVAIGQVSLVRLTGQIFPAHLVVRVLNAEGDHVHGVSVVVTDVSQDTPTDIEIARVKSAIAVANHAKNALIIGVSEDLRIPLSSIIALTKKSLLEHGISSDSRHRALETILGYSKSLLSSINDLKDFAMIEAGNVVPHIELVSMEDLLSEAVSVVKAGAEESFSFNVKLSGSRLTFRADQRILLKLLKKMITTVMGLSLDKTIYVSLDERLTRASEHPEIEVVTSTSMDPELGRSLTTFFSGSKPWERNVAGDDRISLYLMGSLATLTDMNLQVCTQPLERNGFVLTLSDLRKSEQ